MGELIERYDISDPTKALAGIRDRYLHYLRRLPRDTLQALPGAREAWRRLNQRSDVSCAIATGNWRVIAEHKLCACGFGFDGCALATSDDSHIRAAILATAIARATRLAGVESFEHAVYIGDGVWDYEASRACHIDFIGVGEKRAQELSAAGAAIVLPDLSALDDCLAPLRGSTA